MSEFLKNNYFKLLTSISVLFFSLGFFIFSISNLKANNYSNKTTELKQTKIINPGDENVTGVGIKDDFAYLVDYEVDGRNKYYKIPLSKFKYSNDSGVD